MHLFNLKKSFGRNLALKIDIYKAFDTIEWSFLLRVLKSFGFNEIFVIGLMLFCIPLICLWQLMASCMIFLNVKEGSGKVTLSPHFYFVLQKRC